MHCDRVSFLNGLDLGNVQVIASAKLKGKTFALCGGLRSVLMGLMRHTQAR